MFWNWGGKKNSLWHLVVKADVHTGTVAARSPERHSYASQASRAVFSSEFAVLTSALLDNNLCAKCQFFLSKVKALHATDERFQFHHRLHGTWQNRPLRRQTPRWQQQIASAQTQISVSFYCKPCSWFLRNDGWLHLSLFWFGKNVHARVRKKLLKLYTGFLKWAGTSHCSQNNRIIE